MQKNPGRSMGFWPNSFEGVIWGFEKILVVLLSCFIAFLCDNFLYLTPHPPPAPLRAYLTLFVV